MRYLSVCSGIEAATVAWHPLGWTPAAFSEIEAFPRAVLAHHYPAVPCHGDFTMIGADEYGPIDLLVGGTPCQSFSIAGLRGGLADDRGNLALEYLRLADRKRPRWLVWENVPGVLSSSEGRDFGAFLGALVELGYGFAYRVLDAQFFGVAQRRRRVFVVGHAGDWRSAAAVLFERHSLQGHPAPRREKGQAVTGCLSPGAHPGGFKQTYVAFTAKDHGADAMDDCSPTLRAGGHSGSHANAGVMPAVAFQQSQSGFREHDTHATLDANMGSRRHNGALIGSAVRRLTPRECERLQGFPESEHETRILVCKSEAEKAAIAKSAEANSAAPSLGPSAPVAVTVRIDLERQQVQLHSVGRLPWSASIAELASSSHLPIDPDAFARALAHMHDAVGRLARHGRAASPASIRHSSPALNGSAPVLLCGQEIDELASDAERFTTALASCTKSTTSAHGANSPSFGSTWETLACCVSAAISGFIPDTMRGACSYELSLTTHCGYTFVSYRGKPAADGPRYKALGNSMAVPVMRWIGERIAAAFRSERASTAARPPHHTSIV